ncbi:MAG: sulfotransferase [Desulfobacter sp.]|nr:sulfotransferase [Desulfobacter sp.]WDP85689.1 MAG: sulfotransferase [Desulfobacter sp.]
MKLILIAGSWGSGTTAVIGALNSMGVQTLGPYFESSDPKTKNTFELMSFRNLIHAYVDEATLKHKDNYQNKFIPALKKYRLTLEQQTRTENNKIPKVIALKMPLASICLPQICSVFKTKIILVHRNFTQIEACRRRRNWPPLYGAFGARSIYNKIFIDLIEHKLSFLGISYHDFVNNKRASLEKIIEFGGLQAFQENLKNGEDFIRTPRINPAKNNA